MTSGFIVSGTDTDIGKTVFAAALLRRARSATTGSRCNPASKRQPTPNTSRLFRACQRTISTPRPTRLQTPCSPHRAAELDGIQIDLAALASPVN